MCNLNCPPPKLLPPSKISDVDDKKRLAEADKQRAREILHSCYTPVRISIPPAFK